ncbi:hypothetical protein [Streptomyces sp. NPDC057909]|uniref:hypothetical protein n=1 Tax=Streptomyces sp. NPDC057909 TaxID=3346277 RepID=UPI0036E507AF
MSNRSQHGGPEELDAVIGNALRQAESAVVVDGADLARRREALLSWMTDRIEADRESNAEDADFGRRLLLAVDAEGYGRVGAVTQREFQEAITRLLGEAADAARLDRARWVTQEGEDWLFAVLPEGASEPALVDTFMRALDAGLRAFNRNRVPQAWLRLRAAVHFGPASVGAKGVAGQAPVEIGRLLDCVALRSAHVQVPDACLAVGVSATVFHNVVQEAHTSIRTDEFRHVVVEEKEYRSEAWIWIPGADVRQLDPEPTSEETTPGDAVFTAATMVVQLLATAGWERAQAAIGGLWRGYDPERADEICVRLKDSRAELLASRDAGDEQAERDLVAEWGRRLLKFTSDFPEKVDELHRLLTESEHVATMSTRSSVSIQVHSSGSAQVYQGGVETSRH